MINESRSCLKRFKTCFELLEYEFKDDRFEKYIKVFKKIQETSKHNSKF